MSILDLGLRDMTVSFPEPPLGVTCDRHDEIHGSEKVTRWVAPHVTIPVLGSDRQLTVQPERYGDTLDDVVIYGGPRAWNDHESGYYSPHIKLDVMRRIAYNTDGRALHRAASAHAGFGLGFIVAPAVFNPGALRRSRPALALTVNPFGYRTSAKADDVTIIDWHSYGNDRTVLVDPVVFCQRVTRLLDALDHGEWIEDPTSKRNKRLHERAQTAQTA
jgi:hypothetical protein